MNEHLLVYGFEDRKCVGSDLLAVIKTVIWETLGRFKDFENEFFFIRFQSVSDMPLMRLLGVVINDTIFSVSAEEVYSNWIQ